jgi:adenylate cyclase
MAETGDDMGRGSSPVSWHHAALAAAALAGIVGLLFAEAMVPALLHLEHWTADWRTALLADRLPSAHPGLALVEIDAETLEPYPFMLPVARDLQADIVRAVERAGARAIALDFYYTKATTPEADAKLAATLRAVSGRLILGVYENRHAFSPAKLQYEYGFLDAAGASVGYLNLQPDADGVIRRRAAPDAGARYQQSFSELMASRAGGQPQPGASRIAWLLPPRDGGSTFLRLKAQDLLKRTDAENAALLHDRVVIIAGAFPFFDRHRTPLSLRRGGDMNGAEIHAQMAAELIDGNRSYRELTIGQAYAFLLGLSVVGGLLGWRFRRRRLNFLDWRVVSILVIALDALLFKFAHLVLPFTPAAFAWIASVTLGTQSRNAIRWFRQWLAQPH